MKRILTYTLHDLNCPVRISQYLKHLGYSRHNITELKKREEYILVNGRPKHMTETLTKGDILTVRICEDVSSLHVPPVLLPLSIVYEDQDILILNKPAKMPVHPSAKNCENTVANALAWYYEQQDIPFTFRCTNRLDQDTSGLLLIAKHMVSSSILSAMTREHKICREYLAIVRGHVTPDAGTIDAPLARKPGALIERIVDFEHGETAVTHYQTVFEKNSHTLVSLRLETGRTHQIRIHMKHLGFPLIGDYLYNPDMEYIDRQALHASRLILQHPITGKTLDVTAPLPDDMSKIVC